LKGSILFRSTSFALPVECL